MQQIERIITGLVGAGLPAEPTAGLPPEPTVRSERPAGCSLIVPHSPHDVHRPDHWEAGRSQVEQTKSRLTLPTLER